MLSYQHTSSHIILRTLYKCTGPYMMPPATSGWSMFTEVQLETQLLGHSRHISRLKSPMGLEATILDNKTDSSTTTESSIRQHCSKGRQASSSPPLQIQVHKGQRGRPKSHSQ